MKYRAVFSTGDVYAENTIKGHHWLRLPLQMHALTFVQKLLVTASCSRVRKNRCMVSAEKKKEKSVSCFLQ